MSDNEYWIRFWLLGFGTLLGTVTIITLYNGLSADSSIQNQYPIDYIKAMKEQGYTKQMVGCEKPIFDFVKEIK